MTKIPLRAYVKEIENLIDRGEIEQAVAHGKNILKSYPKHIDTYRLLGKAFLESQRYTEASDILQRVLSVIPDDFVSQIGMSIIREDEGNLDAAIWHMERAYEVQPFNPAVQDELRRLYGRRDGAEPPKIRLTRGALVRMYAKGELYPQAIAETRAALAEDPQRVDLRVLLARLYFLSGHKNDAAEVCSELISKLPYCYEANRLLTEILPGTSRAEEAKKFQQRIYALDPYEAFISPTAPTSDQVPDQAVMVEQFTWESAMQSDQAPEWTQSVGVQWEETEEQQVLPDWLNTLKPDMPTSTAETTVKLVETQPVKDEAAVEPPGAIDSSGETAAGELIPDWMQEAGWIPTDRKADDIMAAQPESNSDEIAPAEIPDWLQSLAPAEAAQPAEQDEESSQWLESILTTPGGTNSKENGQTTPASFESLLSADDEPLGQANATTEAEPALPDWLSGIQADAAEALPSETIEQVPATDDLTAENDLPDWFTKMQEDEPLSPPVSAVPASPDFESLPDWSAVGDASTDEASKVDETPDWLKSFDQGPAEQPVQSTDKPEWLTSFADTNLTPAETDAAPDWLNSISPTMEDQSAETMGLAQQPEMSTDAPESDTSAGVLAEEELPDWLKQLQGTREPTVQDAVEIPVEQIQPDLSQPVEAITPNAEIAMPDLSDTDAAMAWLESLAARQGADEATLTTTPEQRTDTPPDWVMKEMDANQTGSVETNPSAKTLIPGEQTAADAATEPELPDWLSETQPAEGEPARLEQEETTPLAEADLPSAMVETNEPGENPAPVEAAPTSQAVTYDLNNEDAAMGWLESLAAKQGADEATLVTPVDQRTETPPDWVKKEMDSTEPAALTGEMADGEIPSAQEETIPEKSLWMEPEQPVTEQSSVEPTQPIKITPAAAETAVSEPEMVQNEAIPAATPEAGVPDFNDMDAAMAWLESLAAKQGADEATLVTPVDQRTETPPDWVTKEMENQAAETPAEVEAPETHAPAMEQQEAEQAEIPDWLKNSFPEEEQPSTEAVGDYSPELESLVTTEPEAAAAVEMPEAAGPVQLEEGLAAETPQADAAPELSSEMDMDAAFAWLESLAAKQGADEGTLVNAPEDRREVPPEWVQKEQPIEQTPDLREAEESTSSQSEEKSEEWLPEYAVKLETSEAEPTEELPDWLRQIETEEQPSAASVNQEDIPDWLIGLDEGEVDQAAPYAEMPPSPSEFRSAWTPEVEISEPIPEAAGETQIQSMSSTASDSALGDVQQSLKRGDLDQALAGYNGFINDGEHLDVIIHDLRDALYRYPVDISIWQTLGDAYARNNQLQEALDAYTKAEDLLR